MFIGGYSEKMALLDLTEILRVNIQPQDVHLSARDIAAARKRLECLTPRELLEIVLLHHRQRIPVLPRMGDRMLRDEAPPRPVGMFPEWLAG